MIEALIAATVLLSLMLIYSLYLHARKSTKMALLEARELQLQKEIAESGSQAQHLREELKGSFASLAAETLKSTNEQLFQFAEVKMNQQHREAQLQLENKQNQIQNIVEPLKKTLGQFFEEVSAMEKERQRSYALVENELQRVVKNSHELSQETRALKNALKKPNVRGRWGEVQLKNCVELAGMSEFADVTFQDVSDGDDGKKMIPDMTVVMPGGRRVIVDAKTPLDAFLSSLEAKTEEERHKEMVRHGKQVKNHIIELSRKSYGGSLKDSADFTVMFLPNESFLYAALETQGDLVEFAMAKKILVATPPTFVGLLKVIRYGWNEDKLTKNAEEISAIGIELHKRVADFLDAYMGIGKSLSDAQEKYEVGLKRLNSRVLVQAKKMEKLGVKSSKNLPAEN